MRQHQNGETTPPARYGSCCETPANLTSGVTQKGAWGSLTCVSFSAEEEIYRKFADGLVRYATVLVGPDRAHDAVGDAFVGALRSGRLVEVSNTEAYLYRAVHNSAVTILDRASRRERREVRAVIADRGPYVGDADLDVVAVLAQLSPRQRAVIWLTYWDDLTPTRVADVLGISVGSVKRHLARARAAARKALG